MKRSVQHLMLALVLLWPAISQSNAAGRECNYGLVQDTDKVIANCTALIPTESDPFHLSEYYAERCYAYTRNGEYERALADCNEAIRLNSNYIALTFRGSVYDKMGNYDRALADIDEALVEEFHAYGYSNDASRLSYRGTIYRHKGDYDRAIRDYDNAIALVTMHIDNLEPQELAEMYKNRAFAKQLKGDIAGAEADFEEATRNSLLIRCLFTAQFILPEDCPYNR